MDDMSDNIIMNVKGRLKKSKNTIWENGKFLMALN